MTGKRLAAFEDITFLLLQGNPRWSSVAGYVSFGGPQAQVYGRFCVCWWFRQDTLGGRRPRDVTSCFLCFDNNLIRLFRSRQVLRRIVRPRFCGNGRPQLVRSDDQVSVKASASLPLQALWPCSGRRRRSVFLRCCALRGFVRYARDPRRRSRSYRTVCISLILMRRSTAG